MKQVVSNKFFLVIILMLFFSSCGEREPYYQFKELKNGDWAIDETLLFEVDSTNIMLNTPYDISIELTNNMDYPYRNLWIEMAFDTGDSIKDEKKLEFVLADEYARWIGDGFGSLFQSSHVVQKGYIFKDSVNLKINIRHIMKDLNLHGIEKIGVKIKKQA